MKQITECVKLYREVKNNGSSTCVELSEEESAIALKIHNRIQKIDADIEVLKQERNDLTRNCKHPAIYDEQGFPYDFRHCVICGDISIL